MIGKYYISTTHKSKQKKVRVVAIAGDSIQVKYLISNVHCWYNSLDFKRLFKPLSE